MTRIHVRIRLVIIVIAVFSCACSAVHALEKPKTIHAGDYGLHTGEDAVPAIRAALQACREQGASKLIFPKGDYHCHADMATEKYLRISNNDNGMKRVVFPLERMKDFEIDGQDARFIMHGHIVPFDVEGCQHNTCEVLSPSLVSLFSAQNLVFRGNTITPSKTYPMSKEKQDAFHIRYCKDVRIEDNDFQLADPVTIKADKYSKNIVVKGNKGMVE